jgi:hypothetical protein
LVSIHHQLEITFQFDHRFEDIKAKIPIIIASIPTYVSTTSNGIPLNQHSFWSSVTASESKYPFETITRFESMSVVPEQNDRSVPRASEDSSSHRGISSLLIDPGISDATMDLLSPHHPAYQQQQQQQQQRQQHLQQQQLQQDLRQRHQLQQQQLSYNNTTSDLPIWKSALPLPPPSAINTVKTAVGTKSLATRKSSEDFTDNQRHQTLFPDNNLSVAQIGRKKSIKRYNSEYDLNAFSNSTNLLPMERPRTTTPMQRRQKDMTGRNNNRRRRPLPPIDVELANGAKPKSLPRLVNPLTDKSTSSSEVLPKADRSIIVKTSTLGKDTKTNI